MQGFQHELEQDPSLQPLRVMGVYPNGLVAFVMKRHGPSCPKWKQSCIGGGQPEPAGQACEAGIGLVEFSQASHTISPVQTDTAGFSEY